MPAIAGNLFIRRSGQAAFLPVRGIRRRQRPTAPDPLNLTGTGIDRIAFQGDGGPPFSRGRGITVSRPAGRRVEGAKGHTRTRRASPPCPVGEPSSSLKAFGAEELSPVQSPDAPPCFEKSEPVQRGLQRLAYRDRTPICDLDGSVPSTPLAHLSQFFMRARRARVRCSAPLASAPQRLVQRLELCWLAEGFSSNFCASARTRSERARIPTSLPSRVTGTRLMFFVCIR